MKKYFQIFVSSTSDLDAERRGIKEALYPRFHPVLYEDYPAKGISPKEWCEREIKESDLVVGLVGDRAGTVIEGFPVVEWEFERARHWGVWLSAFVKRLPPGTPLEEPQRAFREKVSAWEAPGLFRGQYDSVEELVSKVKDSVTEWLIVCRRDVMRRWKIRVARWLSLVFPAGVLFMLLTCAGVVLSYWWRWIGADAAVGSLGGIIIILLAVYVLFERELGPRRRPHTQ